MQKRPKCHKVTCLTIQLKMVPLNMMTISSYGNDDPDADDDEDVDENDDALAFKVRH